MRNFLIGLVLTIVGIAALMLIPSTQQPAPMPWEVTIMQDGNIKVFDIHLGTTTYRQAQQSFQVYGKTAVFTQQDKQPTVEAFFNSINLGGLSAKVVLNLAVEEQEINDMLNRALEARLQPSGAHRYELGNSDNATLIDAPVTAITYIPSLRLNQEMVLHRFGNADNIEQDPATVNTEIWHYPAIGLTIRFSEGKKTILQYHSGMSVRP